MRPHPTIRKTIKWGGAAGTVLLVVVWIGSGWVGPRVWVGRTTARWSISHGCFVQASQTGALPFQAGLPWGDDLRTAYTAEGGVARFVILWWPSRAQYLGFDFIAIPFWPVILASAAPFLAVCFAEHRARRRARDGYCPKCSYDRAGIAPAAMCPECGAMPSCAEPTPSVPHV